MFTLLKAWQDLWISIPISSSCLVTKLCQTICNPTDCSTPGFAVLHHLPVCSNSCPLSLWCHPTISSSVTPFFSCLQSFPASGSFLMSWLFASGGRNIGASASTSVLPMNIQGWFSLGLTGLVSMHSKGHSRVFSNTTVWKHLFFRCSYRDNKSILKYIFLLPHILIINCLLM